MLPVFEAQLWQPVRTRNRGEARIEPMRTIADRAFAVTDGV
jgi:hypothetical protein